MTIRPIEKRVAKLEERNSSNAAELFIAVVRAALPTSEVRAWATALVERHGWSGLRMALWAIEGADEVVIPRMSVDLLDDEQEDVWLRAADQCPHVLVLGGAEGLDARRFESSRDWKTWGDDIREELKNG